MSPSLLDDVIEEMERKQTFSDSEKVYLEFRRVADPGMVDAGFDLIPSKSSDVRQKSSGERFTDQTLRGHILNGAAFGAQLNRALTEIDPESALDQTNLRKALSLFACHDFHKTDAPQKRRLRRERGLDDEDKDLREAEVRELVDTLNLNQLETSLKFKDYYASALSAEKLSGRHRQVASNDFDRLRDWVRMMDAAAGLQTPSEANSLEARVKEISDNVRLHYHSVDDGHGVSTNILNHTISEHLTVEPEVEELVRFHNGAIYLSSGLETLCEPTGESTLATDTLDAVIKQFIETVKRSRQDFQDPTKLQGFLNTAGVLPKGYLKVNATSYFLSGVENILAAARTYLQRQARQDNWSVYSVYSDALIAAVAWNVIEKVPQSHNVPQALGIYAGTVFMELFKPLNGGDTRAALEDLCDALQVESTKEHLLLEYDTDETPVTGDDFSSHDKERLSDGTGIDPDDIDEIAQSIDLHGGGNKAFAQVAVMDFISGTTADGIDRRQFPIEELLEEMEALFLSYYTEWNEKWDENRGDGWDADWNTEQKRRRFELELQGVLPEASEHYVRSTVEIDGYWFPQETAKDKYNEYTKKNQGHICLLCNDVLIGDTSLKSFGAGQDTVGRSLGFTHLKQINPTGGEPNAVICPICDLEMTLRNSVYEASAGTSSQYLVAAPDYFLSPVDVHIEKALRGELYDGGGGGLLQTAQQLLRSDPSSRGNGMSAVWDVLKVAEEQADFQNMLKNFDAAFDIEGTIGVYRLDSPRRMNDPTKEITRVPRWYLSTYFAVVFSWLTSSRVLLTNTPIPTTGFEDFNEMVLIEGAPPPVQRFVGETVTISRLGDWREWEEYEFSHLMKESSESGASTEGENNAASRDEGQLTLSSEHTQEKTTTSESNETTTRYELQINTGLAASLYKLSAFTYVGLRTHGFDVQRFASLLSDAQEPFVGASSLLKGSEQSGDYTALRAADILDTLIHKDMSNRLEDLAEAGFKAARPDPSHDSNHEYERLFRVARDAISDGLTRSADRDELIDIVAGDVMKASSRARRKNARNEDDRTYASERYTREPAQEFARIFVDDVYLGMCDGEFYELRRLENRLASGYNAAIRRYLQEWFDEHTNKGE